MLVGVGEGSVQEGVGDGMGAGRGKCCNSSLLHMDTSLLDSFLYCAP